MLFIESFNDDLNRKVLILLYDEYIRHILTICLVLRSDYKINRYMHMNNNNIL